tara:strand:- start:486 stop:701 length:216 start_codon:yes stop_codon:yes gene_type:complete
MIEQVTNSIGNPITLLIERIFWLGLGAFFVLAIATSLIRGLNSNNIKTQQVTPKELENLAKRATEQNRDLI